jgi:ABC-2 type transport system permease protein
MKQNFKALTGFHADFVIMLISSALTQLLGIVFLWVVYQRIPTINGWEFWEVAFIYAMIFFSEGFASLLFEGCWSISGLVNHGELDRMLIRPVSPILQVLSYEIGINGVSNIVIGSIIIIQALQHVDIRWSLLKVLISILLMISAIIIRGSINFISNSSAFWTHYPGNAVGFMVHSISEFAKYPITIYSFALQAFITFVIPYAFISFFPAAYLFYKGNFTYIGLLSPIVAIYCFGMAILVFKRGLKKYESAGN